MHSYTKLSCVVIIAESDVSKKVEVLPLKYRVLRRVRGWSRCSWMWRKPFLGLSHVKLGIRLQSTEFAGARGKANMQMKLRRKMPGGNV